MAINKRIKLVWKDKAYDVLMTMRLIEQIEEHINLSRMVSDCSSGDLKVSHASRLIATILESAGAEVTTDEIWEDIFGGGDFRPSAMVETVTAILGTIFPEPKKKPTVLNKKPAKPKGKRTTRGKTSIN